MRRPKKASSGGGRPPVNLWPRRIITGVGLLLIIALIVWGIVDVEQATEPRFSSVSVTGIAEPDATGLAFAVAVMSRSRQAGISIVVPSVSRPSAVAS